MALLLTLVLGAPALAHAGDEGDDLGTVAGLNYRVNVSDDFVGSGLSSFVVCLDGDRPIAGGIDLEGSGATGRMGSTNPSKEGDFRLWRSAGFNLAGGTKDMSFFGICRQAQARVMKFRAATRAFNPGKRRTVKAACPEGFRVVGGGIGRRTRSSPPPCRTTAATTTPSRTTAGRRAP